MTKQEICEQFGIEDPVYFFEPEEVFNKGILGVSEDHRHIIYGYYTLVSALAEDNEKEWNKKKHKEDEEVPDFYFDAMEFIDKNTIGTIPYLDEEKAPIIIYEMPKE